MHHGLSSSSVYPTMLMMNRQYRKGLKIQVLTVSTEARLNSKSDSDKVSDCSVSKHGNRAKKVKHSAFIPSSTYNVLSHQTLSANGVPVCLGRSLYVNVLLQCVAASTHTLSSLYYFHPFFGNNYVTCYYYQWFALS